MKLKTIIQYLIFFGLAVFLLWYANKNITDKDAIVKCLHSSRKDIVLLIVIISIGSNLLRALRWQLLIEPLGKRPKLINTFLSIFIGYGVNFFTPRLGEVVRCGVLSKYENISVDKLAGTMIAERIIDLICLILLVVLTLTLQYDVVMNFFITSMKERFGENGITYLIIFLVIGAIIGIVLLRFMLKANAESKIGAIIKNLAEGITSVFKMNHRVLFIVYTFLLWLSYLSTTYLSFLALQETNHLSIGTALSILTFGSLGFLFPFGGAGAYQLIVSNVLTTLYKIPETVGSIYGLLSWAVQNGILLVGAFVSFILFPFVNKSKN